MCLLINNISEVVIQYTTKVDIVLGLICSISMYQRIFKFM